MSGVEKAAAEAFKDWGKPPDPSTFKPGLYRHYKGGLYYAVLLAEHHETREPCVVYASVEHGTMNVRPWAKEGEDSWTDRVHVKHSIECAYAEISLGEGWVQRFERVVKP